MKAKIDVKPEIKIVKLAELKPAPYNPREISNEALMGLRMSLMQFGYIDLLVVNKRNKQIVAGNQRYKIFQTEGIKSAPVIMVDVDKMQEKAMNISLNNAQIAGIWTEALIPILEQLRHEMPDGYIGLRLQELREEVKEFEIENMGTGKTLSDDIPEPPKDITTERGDLWILGEHRLLCGDSLSEKDVAYLMNDKKAKLFATDPPYMVDYTGLNRPKGKGRKKKGGKDWSNVYHEVDIKDAKGFLKGFLSTGIKFIEKNAAIYIWHAIKRLDLLKKVCDELKILIHQQIIWVKPCATLTYSLYPWRHEPCLLCWQKGYKPIYRGHQNKAGTVWIIDFLKHGDPTKPEYYTDVWELDWEGKKRNPGFEHPTVKPTEVFAIPMRVHTKVGDICYEPFCGSGSQIIAAERLNRRCFANEIEPFFCDVTVKRWEEFTGKKAKRIRADNRR
ncbi:MAG: DNA modification methylase [Candidatus Asgardarchaeia archaeon]